MEVIALNTKTAVAFYSLLLPLTRNLAGSPATIVLGVRGRTTGLPLAALAAVQEADTLFIRSLYVAGEYRRQGIARLLLQALIMAGRERQCRKLYVHYALPTKEIVAFDQLLCRCGFEPPQYQGEIFCFNPYKITGTPFVRKTFARGSPFLPAGWQVVRYSDLTASLHRRLETAAAVFPDYLSYKLHWDRLDLAHSIILLNAGDIIGYLSQVRLSTHSATVPCFAVNPRYRGAGVYLLKYYMYVVRFEAPEIFEIRCHFTAKTLTGRKLFDRYAEKRYHRHSLEKAAELRLQD